jgi:hypothetical protein
MRKLKRMGRFGRGLGFATLVGAMATAFTSSGCGDDSVTCLAYACSTSAQLVASVPCDAASANFDVALCNGDDCSTAVIAWSRDAGRSCTDDLAPVAGPSGFQQSRAVCAEAQGQVIGFTGFWDSGKEGIPTPKTFRLRVANGATGEVLIDESASGDFEPGSMYDHCHACYHATIDLGASSLECTPSS